MKAGKTVFKKLSALAMRTMPLMVTCQELEGFMVDYLEGTLPRAQRRKFDLHLRLCPDCGLLGDIEGYDTEETAALLGLTPGAVKTRLHRARTALKSLLAPVIRGGTP